MIRVYSANFSKTEMRLIAKVFRNACEQSFGSRACYECANIKVCMALNKAADYCDRKASKMVES